MIKVSRIPARELSVNLRDRWSELQRGDEQFMSPFFRPEFFHSSALFRDDIYVGVMEQKGEVVGFFPFRLDNGRVAKPVYMCDYQGVIVEKGVTWTIEAILKGCGLVAWEFSQLIESQALSQKTAYAGFMSSQVIRLKNGFNSYLDELRRKSWFKHSRLFSCMQNLEMQLGQIIFKYDVPDVSILRKLLKWKSDKFRNGKAFEPWTIQTLEHILLTRKNEFSGVLSALYAGNEIVSAHFGMCSNNVLHYWFPAYNTTFSRFAPGFILLLKILESMPSYGIEYLDLGPGGEKYKTNMGNDTIRIAEGFTGLPSFLTFKKALFRNIRVFIQKRPYLSIPLKRLYRLFKKL